MTQLARTWSPAPASSMVFLVDTQGAGKHSADQKSWMDWLPAWGIFLCADAVFQQCFYPDSAQQSDGPISARQDHGCSAQGWTADPSTPFHHSRCDRLWLPEGCHPTPTQLPSLVCCPCWDHWDGTQVLSAHQHCHEAITLGKEKTYFIACVLFWWERVIEAD